MSLEGIKIQPFVISKLYKEIVLMDEDASDLTPKQVVNAVESPTPPMPAPVAPPLSSIPSNIPSAPLPKTEEGAPLSYLGSNQQHIAILVHYPNDKHIGEASLDLLSKILAACQLNLAGVAIVNTAHQTVNYSLLQEQLQSKVVILFGIQATQIGLPMQFPLYKDQNFANVLYLQADALDHMLPNTSESKTLKSHLWAAFKRIFNL